MTQSQDIYQVGGSLPPHAPTYVIRPADEDLYQGLKAGDFCYVLNSRQMGKSSLRVRVMQRLQAEGCACAAIDITAIGTVDITPEEWYAGVIDTLVGVFKLYTDFDLEVWWQENNLLSPVQKLGKFIESVLLVKITEKIVIFIDEIDSILSLNFKDDFFAAIRACYNQRVDQPEYQRLTFALLGVATPGDLMSDKKRTPFNLGTAIQLCGFELESATPLVQGLVGKVENTQEVLNQFAIRNSQFAITLCNGDFTPQTLLKEVLFWTGGQPFLTQKVCKILGSRLALSAVEGEQGEEDVSRWVGEVIKTQIIDNWEAQDEPEHLRTIRDRITRNEQRAGRLLGLYQQILQQGELPTDNSSEQMELRLTGLVVKEDGKLRVYNRIYQGVFNGEWVEKELAKMRPYSQALTVWLESNRTDESRLLRGQALQDALDWAKDKSLGDEDYRFLAASQELDKREIQFALAETEKKAQRIIADAERKAKRTTRMGFGILAVGIVGITGAGLYAQKLINDAETATTLERDANSALGLFDTSQIDGLFLATKTGQDLKKLLGKRPYIDNYPVLLALKRILSDIRERNHLTGHTSAVNNANFSPDGKRIVTASLDKTTRVWDTFTTVTELKGHTYAVNSTIFSPDGKAIVTASADKIARVWDTSGKVLAQFKGHTSTVNSARFSPDGKRILTASSDNTARVWDTSGKVLAQFKGHTSSVISVIFSPDGKRILTASWDKTARLWDTSGQVLTQFKGHKSAVNSAIFSPDGKRILSASWDKTARLWDTSGQVLTQFKGHKSAVNSAIFSPDGKRILTASGDKTARLWDTSGKVLAQFKGHKSAVNSAIFSPDGKRILTTSSDNSARLWDTSGEELNQLKGYTDAVYSAIFSPSGEIILTTSGDNIVSTQLWQMAELDDLLTRGCDWLSDYLAVNIRKLQELEVCQQNTSIKIAAVASLVKLGEDVAKAGNVEEAVAILKTALKWNSQLKFDPQKKTQELVNQEKAKHRVREGVSLVKYTQKTTMVNGQVNVRKSEANVFVILRHKTKPDTNSDVKEIHPIENIKNAITAYQQAQKLDAKVEIDANSWNNLCKQGSLYELAKDVMFACENAVKLAPDNGSIRDSRGLARALTGDYQGAIPDFEAFITQTDDKKIKAQRQGWVKTLRQGKNPFTKEVLEKLRN
ncbi:AAA-like domain-containing protein [Calothrix sp. 336/3]|uniref:AAA-like domain-containing protein n=1 Tax=Calothrix sp. 336/3 TaxID=1337936 RepID=UPI0004E351D8|nr:AAA-like domain-containing protein [Calothrix sp. 336/3]AKG21185.1 hypothetical protein IJ00_07620 [Calothrix sp. 336/3]